MEATSSRKKPDKRTKGLSTPQRKARRLQQKREFNRRQLNIGEEQHARWQSVRDRLGVKSDKEMARLLLDSNTSVHPGLSDHFAIMASLRIKKPPTPKISVSTRRLKTIDIHKFCEDVTLQLSSISTEISDVDSYVTAFENNLRNVMDVHAAVKTYTKKLNSISPWFNDDIRSVRKLRRQLERKWRQKGKLEVYR
ncbi:hypothetical protein HOLleu_43664 [Holothuria leucospilota]|uniref:Uncharacterized protein n=1 Tax=Holothuria leucospilota TaxID=206669 RepID=A0A9Q0YGP9_HOLLE|nr:hypothetical protein HOLleu_43664 [Holothuria leucospilota]